MILDYCAGYCSLPRPQYRISALSQPLSRIRPRFTNLQFLLPNRSEEMRERGRQMAYYLYLFLQNTILIYTYLTLILKVVHLSHTHSFNLETNNSTTHDSLGRFPIADRQRPTTLPSNQDSRRKLSSTH
jgi:hypothetical protein